MEGQRKADKPEEPEKKEEQVQPVEPEVEAKDKEPAPVFAIGGGSNSEED